MADFDDTIGVSPERVVESLIRQQQPDLGAGPIDPTLVLNRLIRKTGATQQAKQQQADTPSPVEPQDFSSFGTPVDGGTQPTAPTGLPPEPTQAQSQPGDVTPSGANDFSSFGTPIAQPTLQAPTQPFAAPTEAGSVATAGGPELPVREAPQQEPGAIRTAISEAAQHAVTGAGSQLKGGAVGLDALTSPFSFKARVQELMASGMRYDAAAAQTRAEYTAAAARSKPQDSSLYQAGESVEKYGHTAFPTTQAQDESVTGRVAAGLGGLVGMAPGIVAGGAVGGPAGAIAAGSAQMGLSSGGEAFDAAIQKGATVEQATRAAMLTGASSAVLGALPLGILLKPVEQFLPHYPGLSGFIVDKLSHAVQSGVVFAGIGEAQEWLAQKIASEYDPGATFHGDLKRVIASFLTGAIASGAAPPYRPQSASVAPGAAAGASSSAGTGAPPPGGAGTGPGGAAGGAGPQPGPQPGAQPGPQPGPRPDPGTPPHPDSTEPRQARRRSAMADILRYYDPTYTQANIDAMSTADMAEAIKNFDPVVRAARAKAAKEAAEQAQQQPGSGGQEAGPQGETPRETAENPQPGSGGEPPRPPEETLREFGYDEDAIARMGAGTRQQTADMLHKSYPGGPPPRAKKPRGPAPADFVETMDEPVEHPDIAGSQAGGTRDDPIEIRNGVDVEHVNSLVNESYSHAQGEANNIQRVHATWQGIPLTIEAKAGGTRRGTVPKTGEPWETTMGATYGYAKGTEGADGGEVDFFIGHHPESPTAYIIDELDDKTGKFRQHKVFGGFASGEDAIDAYEGSSGKKRENISGITEISVDDLKGWLKDPKATKSPLAGGDRTEAQATEKTGEPAETPRASAGPAPGEPAASAPSGSRGSQPVEGKEVPRISALAVRDRETGEIAQGAQIHSDLAEDLGKRLGIDHEQAIQNGRFEDGFIAGGRFVDRTEGAKIAKGAGQTKTGDLYEDEGGEYLQHSDLRPDALPAHAQPTEGHGDVGQAHHDAIEKELRGAGVDPDLIRPADLARAAEIHAEEGRDPADSFQLGVVRGLVEDGHLSPEQVREIYGEQIAKAVLEPVQPSERGVRPEAPSATAGRPAAPGEGHADTAQRPARGREDRQDQGAPEGTKGTGSTAGERDTGGEARGSGDLGGAAGGERDAVVPEGAEAADREGRNARPAKGPRVIKEPISLLPFIAAQGGLKPHPDLTHLGLNRDSRAVAPNKGPRPLLHGDGLTLDRLIEKMREAGYLPDAIPDEPDTAYHDTVINMIDDELRGKAHHPAGEVRETRQARERNEDESRHIELQDAHHQLTDMLAEHSIPLDTVVPEDLSLAAEIMVDEGLSPDNALERAVIRNELNQEMISPAEQATLGTKEQDDVALTSAAQGPREAVAPEGVELPEGEGPEGAQAGEHPHGAGETVRQEVEATAPEKWWREDLSTFGREMVVKAVGLRPGVAKTSWGNMAPEVREKLTAVRGTDNDPMLHAESPTWAEILHELPKDAKGDRDLDRGFALMKEISGKTKFNDMTPSQRIEMLQRLKPTTEATPAGEQGVLPGAEKITEGEQAQRGADAPLKPEKAQKPADFGLFGDEAGQSDLVDRAREKPPYNFEVDKATKLSDEEARLKGGKFKAIARRHSPWSVDEGYGDTELLAQKKALEKVGASYIEQMVARLRAAGDKTDTALHRILSSTAEGGDGKTSVGEINAHYWATFPPGAIERSAQAKGHTIDPKYMAAIERVRNGEPYEKPYVPAEEKPPVSEPDTNTKAVPWEKAEPGDLLVDGTRLVKKGVRTRKEAKELAEKDGGRVILDGPTKFAVVKSEALATEGAGEHIQPEETAHGPGNVPDRNAGPEPEGVPAPEQVGRGGATGGAENAGGEPAVPRPDERDAAGQPREPAVERGAGDAGEGVGPDAGVPTGDERGPRPTERTRRGPADGVTGENFVIEPGALDEGRSPRQKSLDNVRALELSLEIEKADRPATRAEQAELAKYVGWGGLKGAFPDGEGAFGKGFEEIGQKLNDLLPADEYATARRSIQYAHYTAEPVVRAMWKAAERFAGPHWYGSVFEPGMGVGNFAGMMPHAAAYQGIEFDATTARIAKLLYPQHGVRHADFTKTRIPADSFDLAIGNPPFADIGIKADKAYPQGFLLHDYFFAKSIDAVRPGGVLAFISSAGTMNKIDTAAREYLADRADLLGAIRLPSDAFRKNAGTDVTTDIIFLRKRLPDEPAGDRGWVKTGELELPSQEGGNKTGAVNSYFIDHPDMVLGDQGFFDKLYKGRYAVHARKGEDFEAALNAAIEKLPADVVSADPRQAGPSLDWDAPEKKDGSFYLKDGRLHQTIGGAGQIVNRRGAGVEGGRTAADIERITGLIPVRDALRDVYMADFAGETAAAEGARKELNRHYDAFVKKFGPVNKAEIQRRRPNSIQEEAARDEAREEARYAGTRFDEGSFDPSRMIRAGATTSAIARARKEARMAAETASRPWDEGSFDPDEIPDVILEKRPNIDPFMDDQESYRLRAIEKYDEGSGRATKSPVFYENILTKERPPEIKSTNDAVLHVLNKTGRLDLPEIAKLLDKTESETVEELGERIFHDPQGREWVMRDEYLSGNVRKKLALARAAAAKDPELRRNVEALEAAQPPTLPPSQIHATLGMPWIPTQVVEKFGTEELGLDSLRVKYVPGLAQWFVSGDIDSVSALSTWGTERRRAPALIQDVLNRQTIRITDTSRNPDGGTSTVLNVEATQAANDKAMAIRERFNGWIWKDEKRADDLTKLYNESYNNLVNREFDGSYLTTPGVSSAWSWRPHQTRVISRIILTGNTYMAHAVGAGKTSAMVGAVMEMRRLGLARKPMIAVPNHMLGQFTKEFYEQYPIAKIAVADERRFHTDRRKQFIANVGVDDLDAIIITHSAFGMIPISDKFADGVVQHELDQYRDLLGNIPKDQDNRITRSRIEKQIERLEQRLSGNGSRRKDQVFTFEEMGVDFLFVDEAHLFRKLDFSTNMGSVKGISPEGSQMAWDLYVKTLYLDSVKPNRSLVLASGTPVTNTMAELYTVSRYQQRHDLEERGLSKFDAWAGAFGEPVSELEQDAAGGYKAVSRFSRFVNVPELSNMVRQTMDVVTSKQLDQYVTRPKLKGGKRNLHIAEKSPGLEAYQRVLQQRMVAIQKRKGPPQKGDDIMLSVINDGRHAAIDMRLVYPEQRTDHGSKLNLMVNRAFEIWKATKNQKFYGVKNGAYDLSKPIASGPATQMVFANLGLNRAGFNVPDYIRSELIRRGVPKNEIALIKDYKTHVAKQKLFNDMNEGRVRFMIGSTAKMATGVNAQRRLIATHNLDPLWYPSDDEQRNGRMIRQGNMNPEGEINDYSTKGTYDSTMWGMMARKARFIQAFFEGDKTLRDMDDLGEASQYEQAKAVTTNDPRLIRLTELKQDLERARRRYDAFDSEQYALRERRTMARSTIKHQEEYIASTRKDIAQRIDTTGDKFVGTVLGKTYAKRAEWGAELIKAADLMSTAVNLRKRKTIGKLGGFEIAAYIHGGQMINGTQEIFPEMLLERNGSRDRAVSTRDPARSVENALRAFETEIAEHVAEIEKAKKFLADSEGKSNIKFEGAGDIDRLADEVRALEHEIATVPAESPPPPATDINTISSLDELFKIGQTATEDLFRPQEFYAAMPMPVRHPKEFFTINGRPTWGLIVDPLDNAVVHSVRYKKAQQGDFHHSYYLPPDMARKVSDGDLRFVWADERGIHGMEPLSDSMRAALERYLPTSAAGPARTQGDLTEPAERHLSEIERYMENMIHIQTGKRIRVEFHRHIPLQGAAAAAWGEGAGKSAGGAYVPGKQIIRLALDGMDASEIIELGFHEPFHAVQDILATDQEMAVLDRETPRLREIMRKHEFWGHAAENAAPIEVQAVAYQMYASERAAGGTGAGMHIGVRQLFEKIMRFLRKIANYLRSLGFQTSEDIFRKTYTGEMGKRPSGPGRVDAILRKEFIKSETDKLAKAFGDKVKQLREERGLAMPRTQGFPERTGAPVSSYPTAEAIKAHPDYTAAKAGDYEAALRVVRDTVRPETLAEAKKFGPDAIYLPVIAEEATGHNMLPRALAEYYAAATGATTGAGIEQMTKAYHTGAPPMDRLLVRPEFAGDVQAGGRYVLVDDVTVMGSTLAELAGFIRGNGGEVAGVVTLANASRTGVMSPRPGQVREIQRRFGDAVRELFDIDPTALTGDEATYLLNFRDADALRTRAAAAAGQRRARLASKGIEGEAAGGGVGGAPPPDETSAAMPRPPPRRPVSATPSPTIRDRIADLFASDFGTRFIENFSNLSHRVRILQNEIEARTMGPPPNRPTISEPMNSTLSDPQQFYAKKRLYPGRVGHIVGEFNKKFLNPLIEFMKQNKITKEEAGEYLYALHAEERNLAISRLHDPSTDFYKAATDPTIKGGSGMSKDEADAIIARYQGGPRGAAFLDLQTRIRDLNEANLNMIERYWLETPATLRNWRDTYTDYVPLQGWEDTPDEAPRSWRVGRKFNVRGPEVRQALGRSSKADNPLVNLLDQSYRIIERGERNRYLVSLWSALSSFAPADIADIAVLNKGRPKPQINPRTGLVVTASDFGDRYREEAVHLKIRGEPRFIVFQDKAVAEGVKRMSPLGLGPLSFMLTWMNKMKSLWTHYSPEFLLRHFIGRYPIEGLLNAQELKESGDFSTLRYIKEAQPFWGEATRAIMARQAGRPAGLLGQRWDEMVKTGGAMTFRSMRDTELLREHLTTMLRDVSGKPHLAFIQKWRHTVEAIDYITNALDNSLRLSVYSQARDQGMSPQKAAVRARDATIDYQLRAKFSSIFGVFLPFFNTAMRTGTRLSEAMMRSPNIRKAFLAVIAANAILGLWNYLVGGDDTDGTPYFEKLPPWTRALNIVIMNPFDKDSKGRPQPIKIPLPYNWALPFNIGNLVAGSFLGKEGFGPRAHSLFKSLLMAFTPVGETENPFDFVTPEVLRAPAHVIENKTWTGAHLHEDERFQKGPNAYSGFRPIRGKERTGEGWKRIAETINDATGGSRVKSGMVDFHPEVYREIFDQFFGAQKRFGLKVADTVKSAVKNEQPNPADVPLISVFRGTDYDAADRYAAGQRRYKAEHPWLR